MDLFEKIVNNSNSSLLDFVSFQTTNICIYMLGCTFPRGNPVIRVVYKKEGRWHIKKYVLVVGCQQIKMSGSFS